MAGRRRSGSPPAEITSHASHLAALDPCAASRVAPPPPPLLTPLYLANAAARGPHIAQAIYQGPLDLALKISETLVQRCLGGGGRRWVAQRAIANPIQNRSRRRPNSRHEPLYGGRQHTHVRRVYGEGWLACQSV